MNMKRLVMSLGMLVFVGAVVISGTGAFFSDTETSTANVFTAGAIDLTVDSEQHYNDMVCANVNGFSSPYVWIPEAANPGDFDSADATAFNDKNPLNYPDAGTACDGSWVATDLGAHKFFNFGDVKPGDEGENTISLHVDSNDAFACVDVSITANDDVTCTDPEDDAEGAGTCNTDGAPLFDGELAENLNFFAWADYGASPLVIGDTGEGDNVWQANEPALFTNNVGSASDALDGESYTLADSISGPLAGGSTSYIGLAWCAGDMTAVAGVITCDGAGMGNEAQTDSMVADIAFRVEQARNNPNFTCAPTTEPEPQVLVGAALVDYVAPQVCSVTVSGAGSIQAAEDAAAPGATICVDPTYNGTGDNTRILIDTVGLTLAATVRGVDLDVPVTLSASNVTVTGFDGVIGQAATPAEQAAFYAEGDADLFEISFNTVTGGVGAAILTETGGALGGGLIANNVLDGATQGIYVNPHTGVFTIEYNDIDNNAAGIGGLMGALVRNNEFGHTVAGSEAIGVDPTYNANPTSVEFNNFLNGTMVNTYVGPITPDVDAEDNFWGPTGGAAQTGGTDEVDFTPEAGAAYTHNS